MFLGGVGEEVGWQCFLQTDPPWEHCRDNVASLGLKALNLSKAICSPMHFLS